MTDKVQKIKEWISKTQDGLVDAQGNFEYPEHEGAYHILCNLDTFIDSLQEEPKTEWLQELQERLDSLSKEDFEKVMAMYSRYGEEEPVSEGLKVELNKYIKDHFTIDKEQLDRFDIDEKDYMYSMDRSDMLAMVEHFLFTFWRFEIYRCRVKKVTDNDKRSI